MNKRTNLHNRMASRLLRQLGRDSATARLDNDGAAVLLQAGEMPNLSFPRAAVDQLLLKKLICCDEGGVLSLTEIGRRALEQTRGQKAPPKSERSFALDEFRIQHGSLSKQKLGDGSSVYCNDAESPLLWMRRRKGADGEPMIGAAAFVAGERLRQDYTMSRAAPRMSVDWSNPLAGSKNSGSPGMNATESMIAAGQRMSQALHAVGPEFSGLLFDLCCFLKGLEQIERERRWPVRSAKVVVRLALERLARHYGFSDETRGRERNGAIRAWSSTADAPAKL